MFDKAADTYLSTIQFDVEKHKTQKMLVKVVDICPFVLDSVIDWFNNREKCYKVVSKNSFMLK